MPVDLIASGCSKAYADLAVGMGYLYGHSSDAGKPRYPVVSFLDEEKYLTPNIRNHYEAAKLYRPKYVVLPDVYHLADLRRALMRAALFANHCEYVIIVAKHDDVLAAIPHDEQILVGVSVPTKHGGWLTWPGAYAGYGLHLLGGSPKAQLNLALHLAAVGAKIQSADSNYLFKVARFGTVCHSAPARGLQWRKLKDVSEEVSTDVPVSSAKHSLAENQRMWQRLCLNLHLQPAVSIVSSG